MPYKTQYGKHYHETYGCHGATIPCGTAGLEPCSDCCCHAGEGSGAQGSAGGVSSGGASAASGHEGSYDSQDGTDGHIASISEGSLKKTVWGSHYAYFGSESGMDRPFRLDISSAEDGSFYWQITGAYSQIDEALLPVAASFADENPDLCYIPNPGEWTPRSPRVVGNSAPVGPTFRTIGEAVADANSIIADLGITDETDSIEWINARPWSTRGYLDALTQSMETTTIGMQALSEGMPLADSPSVDDIAKRLADEQDTKQDGDGASPSAAWSRDEAYANLNLTDSARRQLKQGVGYRSELLFGEGHTEAASVLTHETFTMGNLDVIDMLSSSVLAGTDVGKKLEHIAAVMREEESDPELEVFLDRAGYDECDPEGVALFRDEVLPAISKVTGYEVNYVMWLCDSPSEVLHSYGDLADVTEDDIDEHQIGGVMLSDIGHDGVLWGYTDPIEKPDDGWGWW